MATKKSLSDLLRQEASPAEVPATTAPTETSEPIAAVTEVIAKTAPNPELLEELAIAQAKVSELTQALTAEKSQVVQLQNQLAEQKAIAATLTTNLKNAKSQEKELLLAQEKVKELGQQLDGLKPLQAELSEQKALVNQLNATLQDLEKRQETSQTAIAPYQFSPLLLLSRPIGPNKLSNELSNEEIGWFD